MNKRTIGLSLGIGALSCCTAAATLTAQGGTDLETPARIVRQIDGMRVNAAGLSFDGRWIALAVPEGGSQAIWVAAVKGGVPVRLTDAGFQDRIPVFSPTGDRVFFLSNRPTREPTARAQYIMSIGFDGRTGQPVGTPRQVSTDTLSTSPISVSRDGKWLTYATTGPKADVRVLSVNGGLPRIVAERAPGGSPGPSASFTADGKFVVFRDSADRVLRRVPFAGGKAVSLARIRSGRLSPWPYADGEYVSSDPTSDTPFLMERRDVQGRTIASAQILPQYSTGIFRPDGKGLIGARGTRVTGIDRIDLASGQRTVVSTARGGGLLGRAQDGSLLWVENDSGRRTLTRTTPGGTSTRLTLPSEIAVVQGLTLDGLHIFAYGPQATTSQLVRNKLGGRTMQRTRPAYLVDVAAGRSKKLTDAALPGCCARNWGGFDRTTGLTIVKGGEVEVHGMESSGALRRLRSFSAEAYGNLLDVAVSGDRVAWADESTAKMRNIYVATGASSPQLVASVQSEADIVLGWSPDGKQLAAAYADASNSRRAVVRIFRDAGSGSMQAQGEALDLGELDTDYFESLQWVPGRDAVLVVHDFGPQHLNQLVLRPLDSSKPPIKMLSGDQFGGFFLEPDGTSILALRSQVIGSSVWVVPFDSKR